MMRHGALFLNELMGQIASEFDIEKAVAMEMGEFTAVANEADSAETMYAAINVEIREFLFELLHRAKTFAMEESGPGEKRGVEELRREGNFRKEMKMANDEIENHGALSFSARFFTCRMTRRWTARKMSCVHQSK